MLVRKRAPDDPVTIYLDDAPIRAQRGEPIAVALLAAGKVTLARSPKLHRPRAPSCLRGGCDGCLARVDGLPNVMTCLRGVKGGEHVETQNVIGSRESDLLRVTDWFFPKGIDHHHLMAGIPGVSGVVQAFARKLAGLGRLPDRALAKKEARILEADAIVVGAGLAGRVVASRIAASGARVIVVDDGVVPGGTLLGAPELATEIEGKYALGDAQVLACSVAAGVYRGEVLIGSESGATVARARAKVFATGAHDGVLSAPNNDLPGLFSARAIALLAARGIVPEGKVAIVGEGYWADRVGEVVGEKRAIRLAAASVAGIKGTSRVREIYVRDGKDTRSMDVDIVATALPGAPSFEVAEQAGAKVRFDPNMGYAVDCDDRGRAAEGVWASGECTGMAYEPGAIVAQAERTARDVIASLGE